MVTSQRVLEEDQLIPRRDQIPAEKMVGIELRQPVSSESAGAEARESLHL